MWRNNGDKLSLKKKKKNEVLDWNSPWSAKEKRVKKKFSSGHIIGKM